MFQRLTADGRSGRRGPNAPSRAEREAGSRARGNALTRSLPSEENSVTGILPKLFPPNRYLAVRLQ